jgi:hypothetical protein
VPFAPRPPDHSNANTAEMIRDVGDNVPPSKDCWRPLNIVLGKSWGPQCAFHLIGDFFTEREAQTKAVARLNRRGHVVRFYA